MPLEKILLWKIYQIFTWAIKTFYIWMAINIILIWQMAYWDPSVNYTLDNFALS